ncbi:hypothetical protein PF007_g15417 [Phytophthora fragariae]|uniref:Uncharacterized protein n=1 Tax=Phytophthora fragariae TaxID=53985 RepID=A0A6A3EVC6_9STRA|nr:hypothetical protein PF003_g8022 [Phytophthora fragariae]KAE8937452.1 hypothetical protein PF009_g12644 [Phytophthora fragariae]KAE9100683.1 hypothetical protein PF007_g15417 [Phytophthora fragariae]KAE9115652.1 hypothetical protein PF006_g19234 [Phytophthora fragariae]KAE9290505.1 hypothetical protein PF001_g19582 [Phytophthora fragariae]
MRGLHAHNDGRERLLPQRSDEDSDDSADGLPVGNDPAIEPADLPEVDQDAPTGVTPPRMAGEIEFTDEPPSEGDAPEMDTLPEGNIADPVAQLEQTFVSVLRVLNMEGNKDSAGANEGSFEHQAHGVELEDYEQELAFLPDLTEVSVIVLDYSAPNILNKGLERLQQSGLIRVLKKHERIMISSGNALPPLRTVSCMTLTSRGTHRSNSVPDVSRYDTSASRTSS